MRLAAVSHHLAIACCKDRRRRRRRRRFLAPACRHRSSSSLLCPLRRAHDHDFCRGFCGGLRDCPVACRCCCVRLRLPFLFALDCRLYPCSCSCSFLLSSSCHFPSPHRGQGSETGAVASFPFRAVVSGDGRKGCQTRGKQMVRANSKRTGAYKERANEVEDTEEGACAQPIAKSPLSRRVALY